MSEAYTKNDLVKELAQSACISRRRVEAILETLAQVAYRQAPGSFAVPGICRLDVVHRKARQVRNPQTGDLLLIAEHDALRVRAVKRARNAVAPTPRALVQIVSADHAAAAPVAPATPPTPAASAPVLSFAEPPAATAPAPAAAPASAMPAEPTTASSDDGPLISFRCKACGQEIEATLEMIGSPNECPSCGETLLVPYMSEPGTIWYRERTPAGKRPEPDANTLAQMKSRTIRIELPDDG